MVFSHLAYLGAKEMIGRLQAPGDDEDEEEMLRRAFAMSLEGEEVVLTEQKLCSNIHQGAGELDLPNVFGCKMMTFNVQVAWRKRQLLRIIMTRARRRC